MTHFSVLNLVGVIFKTSLTLIPPWAISCSIGGLLDSVFWEQSHQQPLFAKFSSGADKAAFLEKVNFG